MDRFLASVERRAFVAARMAVGNHDDALDIVQDRRHGSEVHAERVLRTAHFQETDRVPVYDLLQNQPVIEHYSGEALTIDNSRRAVYGFGDLNQLGDRQIGLPFGGRRSNAVPQRARVRPGDGIGRDCREKRILSPEETEISFDRRRRRER